MSQIPPPLAPPPGVMAGEGMQPHRGVLILVFGILSWVICFIFGIVAWVMGSRDMRAMDEGVMDPTGRGLTQAGKIVGMISVILSIILTLLGIIATIIMLIVAAGSAAAGATGGP